MLSRYKGFVENTSKSSESSILSDNRSFYTNLQFKPHQQCNPPTSLSSSPPPSPPPSPNNTSPSSTSAATVFPVIGGAEFITQGDDPDCGSCFNITSTPANGAGGQANTVFLTAVNTAPRGFVVCTDVVTDLLGLPRGSPVPPNVPVEAVRVEAGLCGL
ncbi:hypothetical protein CC1G_11785 [Coprinopsis cinerea okayama7|uniref:Expansin-like EG45 domain-containing protein n=1 Tax=Coprinopsis cinerea (strain Okayama-7 / 130 / ATCC MYA-4618 / FGSC 9003) TaxID=240176 RepID=A8NPK0_COPC7|nr:hypothetical protein CC1G_11785 [Coprinopsis cinerea okayama7\|eukprot:XP_001835351.1 hypothetical protein CC1G_11785 [Coprinopsis cinerea okayama7\